MSCPICQKDAVQKYRPFCSKRCADIDLGKWMSGQYAVASTREEDAEEVMDALEEALSNPTDDDASKLH
ncbi:MAG: DNA gyrase inhibitor YacG [Litoreibacter sp.]|nr:DNA gyrase inhibitor YacG [Litoreibacter sp.]MCY4334634.1 DNA gyrase inhibitor YacG [Litoreibacter sp.]